mmetsp:Transcript_20360/g.48914  ORF Transcript_20360/g.48914 Transcript_20360/m.48914 type:complete len:81 (-) Transcript_20360:107-349(-)
MDKDLKLDARHQDGSCAHASPLRGNCHSLSGHSCADGKWKPIRLRLLSILFFFNQRARSLASKSDSIMFPWIILWCSWAV